MGEAGSHRRESACGPREGGTAGVSPSCSAPVVGPHRDRGLLCKHARVPLPPPGCVSPCALSPSPQYVPEDLLPVYREKVVPLADIITPNQFEAE